MPKLIDDLPEGLDFGNDFVPDEGDGAPADEPVDTPSPTPDNQPGDDRPSDDQPNDQGDQGGADDQDDQDDQPQEEGEEGEGQSEQGDDADKAKRKEPMIPKPRLDQALRKQRAAEQRAQELENELARLRAEVEAAKAPKPMTAEEIQALMTQANEALIAGDTEKAAKLQAEVMANLMPKTQEPAPQPQGPDALAVLEERLEFKTVLREVYERFPALDENSEHFDPDLTDEAVDLQKTYMQRGYTMAEATRRAAEAVAKLHGLEDTKAKVPAARAEAARKEQQAKTTEKINKATRAAPNLGGGRSDNPDDLPFDVLSATEEEFMALPEAVRDRLLGNTL